MYYPSLKYIDIDKKMFEILMDYGICHFPVDIVDLAQRMGFSVIAYSELDDKTYDQLVNNPKTVSGFHTIDLRKGFPLFTIYFNDKDEPIGRQRITIGHEIKHIVFDDGPNPTAEQESMADHFGKEINGPKAYLIHENILTAQKIREATGLSIEVSSYQSETLRKRVEKHGRSYMGSEHAYIDYLERTK